jgi:hypothetical protein
VVVAAAVVVLAAVVVVVVVAAVAAGVLDTEVVVVVVEAQSVTGLLFVAGSHHFTYVSAGMDFGSQPGVNGNGSSVLSSSPFGPATPVAVRLATAFPLLTSIAYCRRCCCVDFWWRFKCRP